MSNLFHTERRSWWVLALTGSILSHMAGAAIGLDLLPRWRVDASLAEITVTSLILPDETSPTPDPAEAPVAQPEVIEDSPPEGDDPLLRCPKGTLPMCRICRLSRLRPRQLRCLCCRKSPTILCFRTLETPLSLFRCRRNQCSDRRAGPARDRVGHPAGSRCRDRPSSTSGIAKAFAGIAPGC